MHTKQSLGQGFSRRRGNILGALGLGLLLAPACGGGDLNGGDPGPGTLSVVIAEGRGGKVTSVPAGLDCSAQCSASFVRGTQVTLTAVALDGYEFAGWQGGCTGAEPSCILAIESASSVTASFRATPTVSLLVTKVGSGAGVVRFKPGTTVTLTAAPETASYFKGWSGACSGTSLSCQLSLGADSAVTAEFAPPESCEQIRTGTPSPADGTYKLFVGGDAAKPWDAHCVMSSPAATYLGLPAQTSANYSQYTAGGGRPNGSSVRTQFQRVRIDPLTLRIDNSDLTFSASAGSLSDGSGGQITKMAYGTAGDCVATNSQAGIGNITLTGTPFAVEPNVFLVSGYIPNGGATYSMNDQVVALRGGGFCGGIGPRKLPSDPYNLPLRYIGQ
jgi:hypothetical protein